MKHPWHDCPPCPKCGLPVGMTYSRYDRPLPEGRLRCGKCGHEWSGSDAEMRQAHKADAAWREFLERDARHDVNQPAQASLFASDAP